MNNLKVTPRIKELNLLRLKNRLISISHRVEVKDRFPSPISNLMGVDVAYSGEYATAAGISLSWPDLKILGKYSQTSLMRFPYISSLLSFREGTAIIRLIKSLETKPDILMVNAHGIAHPLLCGCASYIGVLTDTPTIGVAKRIICGETLRPRAGAKIAYVEFSGMAVAAILNSDDKSKQIVISPGHRISLKSAVQVTLKTLSGGRLPAPIQLAHIEASRLTHKALNKTQII